MANETGHFPVKLQASARSIALLSRNVPEVAMIFVHGFRGDPSATWIDFEHLVEESECAVKRRWSSAGEQSRPGAGSFHPVAIEAAAEATKLLKPSV